MPTPAQIIPRVSDETEVGLTIPVGGGKFRTVRGPLVDLERMLQLSDSQCAALRSGLHQCCTFSLRPTIRVTVVAPYSVVAAPQRGAA